MTFVLSLAACGDNKHPVYEDAMTDGGDDVDAPPDAPPDALMCGGAPNMNCSGSCKNTNTDNANCGTCGNACDTGETCKSGICCSGTLTNCGGQCVDLQTANGNCGTCGEVCDTAGTPAEFCQNGTCCGGTQTACGNQCFDTQTDPAHCGNCSTSCVGTSNPDCSSGKCCPDGFINCGGTCVDPESEEAHCGGCVGTTPGSNPPGIACGNGQTCTMGVCCTDPEVSCNGTTCTNTDIDVSNCGACGAAACAGICNEGFCCTGANNISCNGTSCTNTETDRANCGGCAGTAGSDVCVTGENCLAGICCGLGSTNCSDVCVDTLSDASNCGGCGLPCLQGEFCSGGQCAATCGPGEIDCGPDCIDPDADHDNCGGCAGAGGTTCAPNAVCNNGTCGTTCTTAGETLCNGDCVNFQTDPNHCGGCDNAVCDPGDECVGGVCQLDCAVGLTLCEGVCVDLNTDEANCGSCSAAACSGTCTTGICCGPGLTLCGTTVNDCKNLLTDPLHCGSCGGAGAVCPTSDPVCKTGLCCGNNENHCGSTCSDPLTDNLNCGGCAGAGGTNCNLTSRTCDDGICCAANQEAVVDGNSKICCTIGQVNCGGQCVDLTDPMSCGTTCANRVDCADGFACSGGSCTLTCGTGLTNCGGTCVNTLTDEFNCGPVDPASCDDICTIGATCTGGVCGACPSSIPDTCSGVCVNKGTDPANCGTCGTICGSGTECKPSSTDGVGKCCPSGQVNCNGVCKDVSSDEANCGGCAGTQGAEVCTGTSTCQNGDCTCGLNQILCGTVCVTPSVDPNNCGGCGDVPTPGAHECTGSTDLCVSGGCTATCPPPLIECNGRCINNWSDSANCGTCGNACPTGQGCVAGNPNPACFPLYPLPPNAAIPAKCEGGGPPIVLPTGTGTGTICSGSLSSGAFQFALCSRTRLGPLSKELFTDAFNSLYGPYRPVVVNTVPNPDTYIACNTDLDCGPAGVTPPNRCIGDGTLLSPKTCAGGGVGVNGNGASPVATNQAYTHVGGDFWIFGTIGIVWKNDTTVKQRLVIKPGLEYTKTNLVHGNMLMGSTPLITGGQADLRIGTTAIPANLYHPTCTGLPPDPADLDITGSGGINGCIVNTALPDFDPNTFPEPCGRSDNADGSLIKVREIVDTFRNPARNDNATVGLRYDALAAPPQPVRLELYCGYYYLNSLGGSQPVTIVVKGRAALFIGGAADINTNMVFDVEPTASLDMFIAGSIKISQGIRLGNPAFPRLTRMYIGSAKSEAGSATCDNNGVCGSGLCSACPTPFDTGSATVAPTGMAYAACSGMGTCTGGASTTKAIDMSQGGSFNGLLWAGYGEFSSSSAVEMYGAIYVNSIDASGALKIHYDNAATATGNECPPQAPGTSCESCRQCNNQPCVGGTCQTSCTSTSQCCPPFTCQQGTCK